MKGRGPDCAGEKNGRAKLTLDKVACIRNDPGMGIKLAQEYNVSPQLISQVRKHQIWRER